MTERPIRLTEAEIAELERLLKLTVNSEWGNATHRWSKEDDGLYTWRLYSDDYSLACRLRNAAPALLSTARRLTAIEARLTADAQTIRLACGEMSPETMRTVQAVLGWAMRAGDA